MDALQGHLQYVCKDTNGPHVCVEAHCIMVYNLWCRELCRCCGDLHDLLRVEFGSEAEVNHLHICALFCLAQNILRLQGRWYGSRALWDGRSTVALWNWRSLVALWDGRSSYILGRLTAFMLQTGQHICYISLLVETLLNLL